MAFPLFQQDINELLQADYIAFSDDPNPMKTLMEFKDGYYFLPVFYFLCKQYWLNSHWLVDQLYAILDIEFHSLLDSLRAIDPKIIHYASRNITLDTLHFCANNLVLAKIPHNEKFKCLVENYKRIILRYTTSDQLLSFIRYTQKRYSPIHLYGCSEELSIFMWEPVTESWKEVTSHYDIIHQVLKIWNPLKELLLSHSSVDKKFILRFDVMDVILDIMDDRRQKDRDTHKWLLRLQDGVLDLLTGHIGAVIPEFFMPDLKMNIETPRNQLIQLCRKPLSLLYEGLTHRDFFLTYMQVLNLNETDNFYEPLYNLVKDEFTITPLFKSMLHFYINLCKWTCFDYDLFMSLLDSLASVYVDTHSERKMFVWKGSTCNGISQLFQLMKRVLGDYYHHHHTPSELPEPVFNRMITCEAFETEKSFREFQNMYKQHSPTCRIFVATNTIDTELKLSEAVKDKVVVIPFNANFTNKLPLTTTSEQLGTHSYTGESGVVNASYEGCFLMLYYHLKRNMDPKDVLLYYQDKYLKGSTN